MTISLGTIADYASIISCVLAILITGKVYKVKIFSKKSYENISQNANGDENTQHVGDNN